MTRSVIELVPICSHLKSYSRFYCKSARHIHSLLPFVIIPVPSLTVSSTGPAATAQSSRMGVYHLTDQTFNNFPVYENAGGGQFIYVDNGGYWSIMRYVYCTKMIFSTLFVLASYIQLEVLFIIQRIILLPSRHPSQDGNTRMVNGSMMNNSLLHKQEVNTK